MSYWYTLCNGHLRRSGFFIIHIIRSGSDRLCGFYGFQMALALSFLRWHAQGITLDSLLYDSSCALDREPKKKYPRWDWLKIRTSGPRHSILHYRWRKRRLINRIHSLGLICAAFALATHFVVISLFFFSVPRGSHRSHRPRLRSLFMPRPPSGLISQASIDLAGGIYSQLVFVFSCTWQTVLDHGNGFI